MGQPALLIFDVDGTLTYSAGLTRVAYDQAMQEIYGLSNATDGVRPQGRTDPAIFRDLLRRNNLSEEGFQEQLERFMARFLDRFEPLIAATDKARLQPGIREVLTAAADHPDIFLALGTGNFQRGANLKLKVHGIDHYFPVGGFGSDHEDRTEMIRIAHRRSEQHYGKSFALGWTWVIGDTPFDVAAGRGIGARTVAVATGDYTLEQLAESHPDLLYSDLSNTAGFIRAILN
jgi:phosphoglycolate phosphatase-like HAD superfamily hydrolase